MSNAQNPGPPPVNRSAVAQRGAPNIPARVPSTAEANYVTIVETLKANNGADAKAIRAMFGGDRTLMDRFLSVTFSLLARDSDLLQRATPMSIIDAIKTAASMGLEPMTSDGAIVVYDGIATFLPMWQGYIKRIRNSREVVDIDCQVVYENDQFALTLGTDPSVQHTPARVMKDANTGDIIQDRGGFLGVYAWALMPSGKYLVEWMTEAEVNSVRDQFGNKRSRNGKPLPWETSWGEMARKTVIRRFAKRLPNAAVDKLLAAETRHDTALAEAEKAAAGVRREIDEVRQLALGAVGALPSGTVEPTSEDAGAPEAQQDAPAEGQPPAVDSAPEQPVEATAEPVPQPTAPDPGADPNVAAAMALSREEELRRRNQRR